MPKAGAKDYLPDGSIKNEMFLVVILVSSDGIEGHSSLELLLCFFSKLKFL